MTLNTSGARTISGIGGGISIADAVLGSGNLPQGGVPVGIWTGAAGAMHLGDGGRDGVGVALKGPLVGATTLGSGATLDIAVCSTGTRVLLHAIVSMAKTRMRAPICRNAELVNLTWRIRTSYSVLRILFEYGALA